MKRNQSMSSSTFRPTPHYLVTIILSWLIPGAGHWILGYRVRAVVIAMALLATFWVGESVLARNKAVTYKVHDVFFCLQVGNGLSAIVANARWGNPVGEDQTDEIDRLLPKHLNLGILFCSVSGLLNMLVVLHIMDPKTWTDATRPPEEEERED